MRRLKTKLTWRHLVIGAVLCLPIALYFSNPQNRKAVLGYGHQLNSYEVIEIFDGDTISVQMGNRTEKIRMIGIDTPETHHPDKPIQCFGPEAAAFTTSLLDGQRVRLLADPYSTNRDRYDRLLRYVYLVDGQQLQELLLQGGYARAYTVFPFERAPIFKKYEQQAQTQKAGLWAVCPN